MHKKITYMVMGAAVGIILIGSVFAPMIAVQIANGFQQFSSVSP